jgi:hypothetical protein
LGKHSSGRWSVRSSLKTGRILVRHWFQPLEFEDIPNEKMVLASECCMTCHNSTQRVTAVNQGTDFVWSLKDHAFQPDVPNVPLTDPSFKNLSDPAKEFKDSERRIAIQLKGTRLMPRKRR